MRNIDLMSFEIIYMIFLLTRRKANKNMRLGSLIKFMLYNHNFRKIYIQKVEEMNMMEQFQVKLDEVIYI